MFPRDKIFGARGNGFQTRWVQGGYANPPYTKACLRKSFQWQMAHLELFPKDPSWTVFLNPIWDGSNSKPRWDYTNLFDDKNVHLIGTFPENTFEFEHWKNSMFASSRQAGTTKWPLGLYLVCDDATLESFDWFDWVAASRSFFESNPELPLIPEFPTRKSRSLQLPSYILDEVAKVDRVEYPKEAPTKRGGSLVSLLLYLLSQRFNIPIKDVAKFVDDALGDPIDSDVDNSDVIKNLLNFKQNTQNCVRTYLDKNGGAGIICCARRHWEHSRKAFWDDPHYERADQNKETLIENMKEQINSLPKNVKSWKKDADLPYSYILLKNKDLNKSRPIVSYMHHGAKPLLNATARALYFLLEQIPPSSHFNMSRTMDFKSKFMTIAKRWEKAGHNVHFRSGDVKNMYTELPHDEIMNAVDWLLSLTLPKGRFKTVSVMKRGRRGVRYGANNSPSTMHSLDSETIRRVVEFDLQNCLFSIGKINLRQVIGIPMGSPLSPVLAVLLCAFYESNFLQQLSREQRKSIAGFRYVDDVFLASKGDIQPLWEDLQLNCYHENLVLEETGASPQADFLECIIENTEKGISTRFRNKNEHAMESLGKQTFLNVQPWKSYIGKVTKRATVPLHLRVRISIQQRNY
jgi:hypothetical protein